MDILLFCKYLEEENDFNFFFYLATVHFYELSMAS